MVVLLDRGEQVQFSNQTSESFTMMVVFISVSGSPAADRCTDVPGEAFDEVAQWVAVPRAASDQLKDDEAMHVDLAGYPVCLVRSGGAVYAMLDECSHGHVELSEGEVEDGFLECWLHGSRFDLATGIPACPPATEPVPVFGVRITGESVEVALPPSTPT